MDLALGAAAAVLTAVVAGLGVARHARKLPPAKPIDPSDRAVIHTVYALGHDPAKVLIQLVQGKKAAPTKEKAPKEKAA